MNFLVVNMEALTLGSIVLPNIFFMFYFIQSGRTTAAALPVIFFYVMAKTVPLQFVRLVRSRTRIRFWPPVSV